MPHSRWFAAGPNSRFSATSSEPQLKRCAPGAVQPSYEGLNTPSVWRSARSQAAAKVDALSSNGMDEIEIQALQRKQAD